MAAPLEPHTNEPVADAAAASGPSVDVERPSTQTRGGEDASADTGEGATAEIADERLTALRAELETVDQVPVGDRVALFERANDTIARELAELDEV